MTIHIWYPLPARLGVHVMKSQRFNISFRVSEVLNLFGVFMPSMLLDRLPLFIRVCVALKELHLCFLSVLPFILQ